MRAYVHRDGVRIGGHYWNRLPSGIEIDLTRQQFSVDEVVGTGWVVRPPADMRPGRCVEQWELLRQRVFAALGDVPNSATSCRHMRVGRHTRVLIRWAPSDGAPVVAAGGE